MTEMPLNPRNYKKEQGKQKWGKGNFKSKDNSGLLALTISF